MYGLPTAPLELFVIKYANLLGGNSKSEDCSSYEEAKQIVLSREKNPNIAYQWWKPNKSLDTKPAGREDRAIWTDQYDDGSRGYCHLFVWGQDTGVKIGGRYLIFMKSAFFAGGDQSAWKCDMTDYN